MHYEIYKETSGVTTDVEPHWKEQTEWRWRLRAKNGEIVAQGESYTTKRACIEAIELVENSKGAPIEEL